MIHYEEISETDATKVARVRKAEIRQQLNTLNEIMGTTFHGQDNAKMNWGHVGSLSHILSQLEELTTSFGHEVNDKAVRELFPDTFKNK